MEQQVPYLAHEADMARMERTNRRVWIMCIILIVALLGTNIGWLCYESQFQVTETSQVEQEVDTGDGDATVIGIGDYNGNGQTESNEDKK